MTQGTGYAPGLQGAPVEGLIKDLRKHGRKEKYKNAGLLLLGHSYKIRLWGCGFPQGLLGRIIQRTIVKNSNSHGYLSCLIASNSG